MNTRTIVVLAIIASASPVWAAQTRKSKEPPAAAPVKVSPEAPSLTKVVPYGPRDVIRLNTRLRYSTLIVLPKDEVILDYVCGDKELWVIDGEQNFAYVKPAKEGIESNLNLVTQSGNIYSFILNEVSGIPGKTADLKVFVEPTDPALLETARAPRRLVSLQELEDARRDLQEAQNEIARLKTEQAEAVDRRVTEFVKNVRFPYRFEAGKKPFNVRAMYHDDRFTYIQARPEETPTLVELRDNKPNLVNFSLAGDRYVADRIIDGGYLVIGKKRLPFAREE
jgi:type IV secretion system protein VirB9